MRPAGAEGSSDTGLRPGYLNAIENAAQSLGALAPTGTLGVIVPLLIAKAHNGTWLVVLLTFVSFVLILLCIREFAVRQATSGALGTYAAAGLGRTGGIVGGWAYVAGLTFGVASAAPSAAYYFDVIAFQLSGVPGGAFGQEVFVAAIVILAAWAAYCDVKLSTVLMLWMECMAVLVTVIIVLVGMARTRVWVDTTQFHLAGVHLIDIRLSFVLAFLTLAGAESVTTLGAESKNATTAIPRAIFGTLLPVGLLYVTVTYALVALSRDLSVSLDQADAPLDVIARSCGVAWLGLASSVGVGVSYFGCTLASLIAAARVLYAMARDGAFVASYGDAHPTNRTPHRATLLVAGMGLLAPLGLLAAGISLSSCIDYLSQLSAFGYILAYFFVCLAMPFYLYRQQALAPRHLVIVSGALAILGLVLTLSVFPVPPPPWRYLPYIFLTALLVGLGTTAICRRLSLTR
jgi:amino acid transporter